MTERLLVFLSRGLFVTVSPGGVVDVESFLFIRLMRESFLVTVATEECCSFTSLGDSRASGGVEESFSASFLASSRIVSVVSSSRFGGCDDDDDEVTTRERFLFFREVSSEDDADVDDDDDSDVSDDDDMSTIAELFILVASAAPAVTSLIRLDGVRKLSSSNKPQRRPPFSCNSSINLHKLFFLPTQWHILLRDFLMVINQKRAI